MVMINFYLASITKKTISPKASERNNNIVDGAIIHSVIMNKIQDSKFINY